MNYKLQWMLAVTMLAGLLISCTRPQQVLPHPQRLPVEVLFVGVTALPLQADSVVNL